MDEATDDPTLVGLLPSGATPVHRFGRWRLTAARILLTRPPSAWMRPFTWC